MGSENTRGWPESCRGLGIDDFGFGKRLLALWFVRVAGGGFGLKCKSARLELPGPELM